MPEQKNQTEKKARNYFPRRNNSVQKSKENTDVAAVNTAGVPTAPKPLAPKSQVVAEPGKLWDCVQPAPKPVLNQNAAPQPQKPVLNQNAAPQLQNPVLNQNAAPQLQNPVLNQNAAPQPQKPVLNQNAAPQLQKPGVALKPPAPHVPRHHSAPKPPSEPQAAPPAVQSVAPQKSSQRPYQRTKKPVTTATSIELAIPRFTNFKPKRGLPNIPLKIISLGGLGEIGKNITLLEYQNDIIIVDVGLAFPDDDMPGIDLVIPDFSYILRNKDRVRGIVLTHGHEDHIGSLSYLLKELDAPVYSANLTIGLVEGKLKEAGILKKARLNVIKAGDVIKLGCMSVEFIAVNHSIPDAMALAISTPVGMVIHTGDFKIDYTPVDGVMINLARFGELGSHGVLALMCDSTNAERPGVTPSERKVGESFETLFKKAGDKRIIIASFSSNIHRIQQVIDVAVRNNRKVVVSGRSMENVTAKAAELGYLKFPPNTLVDIDKMKSIPDEDLVIITTGSQGEPMSALTRMARGEHRKLSVTAFDFIIISASPIPGNEKLVGKVINDLMRLGADVIYENTAGIHVSGHACKEDIKTILGLTRPKFFIPVHGEYKHLAKSREVAVEMGVPFENVILSDIGRVIELQGDSVKTVTSVPSGAIMVDGSGIGDVGSVVLRDRKLLAEDGLIVAVVTLDKKTGAILSGPDVVSRGFVYVRESEGLLTEACEICRQALSVAADATGSAREWTNLKMIIKDQLGSFLYSKTKRRPMVLPIIQEVNR